MNSLTKLIDCPHQQDKREKWEKFVEGADGCLYGVPWNAKSILRFDPKNQTTSEIIFDFNGEWVDGVLSNNGKIYCSPYDSSYKFLIIDTATQRVTLLDKPLPQNGTSLWYNGALAADGNIYYMPSHARQVLKLDTSNDTFSLVGNNLGDAEYKFPVTIASKNGQFVYGFPNNENKIMKYDISKSDTTSIVAEGDFNDIFCTSAVLDANGSTIYSVDAYGRVIIYNTLDDTYQVIRGKLHNATYSGWREAILGADGNVYCAPTNANKVLYINSITKERRSIGDEFKDDEHGTLKWRGGCIPANGNGFAYFPPNTAKKILQVDTKGPKMEYQNTVGGIDDSTINTPDRLGYQVFADSLASNVKRTETPQTSLCVGLFAPWGSGKTFFWNLMKAPLDQNKETVDEIRNKLKKQKPTIIDKINSTAYTIWFEFTRNLLRLVCCFRSDPKTESVATLMVLSFPLGLLIWIFVLIVSPILLSIKNCVRKKNKSNEPNNDLPSTNTESSDTSKNLNKDVQDILQRNVDVNDLVSARELDSINCLDEFKFIILHTYQIVWGFFSRSCHFIKTTFKSDYKIEDKMTKYIFVNFNAWVYHGTESLWAKLLEELWTNVEGECGIFSVRLHRTKIVLSNEEQTDSLQTKRWKRRSTIRSLAVNALVLLGLSFLLYSALRSFIQNVGDICLRFASLFPLLSFIVFYLIKALPFLLKSRGTKILQDVNKFEKFDRHNFSEETGFMGIVKKEVEYLFDFLQTHYQRDTELEIRRPLRLAVFVDDLDRCQTKTIMQVLQAVILLLVDAPITCWLAIDTRLITTSIEDYLGKDFKNQGLSGYEFLEKIIQFPFCIPDLQHIQKLNFIRTTLERDELDPKRIYGRLVYLRSEGVSEIVTIFPPEIDSNLTEEEDIFDKLKVVLKRMIDEGLYPSNQFTDYGIFEDALSRTNAEIVLKNVTNLDHNLNNPSFQQICEQFLYLISNGIEEVLTKRRKKLKKIEDGSGSESEINVNNDNNVPENTPSQDLERDDFDDLEAQESTTRDPTESQLLTPLLSSMDKYDSLYPPDKYDSLYQPLANSKELKCFKKYVPYFVGKPRKIKRIINSYVYARTIFKVFRPNESPSSILFNKLLKLTILLEQWPYRMSWIVMVVENYQLEQNMEDQCIFDDKHVWAKRAIGCSITDIMREIKKKHKDPLVKNMYDLPVIVLYRYVVRILMYSTNDSPTQLLRDGDEQIFQQILLDDEMNTLKLKDICGPFGQWGRNTLIPYAFNLQRHMVEKVAADIEECVIDITSEDDSKAFISYKKKSDYFDTTPCN